MKRAIFLDRDGTINQDVGHLYSFDKFSFIPQAVEGMQMLSSKYGLFIVTNQSGIGEKVFTSREYNCFESLIEEMPGVCGIDIRRTYCCPHAAVDSCICRKPSPYFLIEASKQFNIDLGASWVIGDHPHDIVMGKRAGTKTAYLLSGHGEKHRAELQVCPDLMAKDLFEATIRILEGTE